MTLTLFFGFPVLLFIYLLLCSLPSSSNMKVIAFSRLSEFTTVEIPCMLVQWLHALMKTQNQRRLSWHFHTCNHTVQSWLSGLIKSDILLGCFDPFNSTGESGSLEARKTQMAKWSARYMPGVLSQIHGGKKSASYLLSLKSTHVWAIRSIFNYLSQYV